MPGFQIGSNTVHFDEPYLVAPIRGGRHSGRWGIFTTNHDDSGRAKKGFFLQEARPNKREAVSRANEMSPAVGGPIGVVVLKSDGEFDRFIPKEDPWRKYSKYLLKNYKKTEYGGSE